MCEGKSKLISTVRKRIVKFVAIADNIIGI